MGRVYFLVYRVLINLLLPVVLVRYLLKGMTRREYRHRLTERFGLIPKQVRTGSIWIHAVSVGEVNAAAPLVRHLLDTQDLPVLISCVTPTGSAQITRLFGDRVGHVYAPVDSGFAVSKTLKTLQPARAHHCRNGTLANPDPWCEFEEYPYCICQSQDFGPYLQKGSISETVVSICPARRSIILCADRNRC